MRISNLVLAAALFLPVAPASAQQVAAPTPAATAYEPYHWLIGDWKAKSGIRELISYGPNRGYVKYSVFTPGRDGAEHLHFEGIALWNAKTKVLDYLFAVEPGSGIQESGTISARADGTIIRTVELIDAKGRTTSYVNTFRRTGANSLETSLMRKTKSGWEPTFPGSEKIEMERSAG